MPLFLSACALTFFACQQPPSPPPPRAPLVLDGVKLQVFQGATADLSGTASRVEFNRVSGELDATNATLQLGGEGTTLSAGKLTGNANQRRFELSNGVELRGRDGITGQTAAAHFDGAKGPRGTVWGEAPVEVKDPAHQATLTATGFTLDVADEHATFAQPKTRLGPSK